MVVAVAGMRLAFLFFYFVLLLYQASQHEPVVSSFSIVPRTLATAKVRLPGRTAACWLPFHVGTPSLPPPPPPASPRRFSATTTCSKTATATRRHLARRDDENHDDDDDEDSNGSQPNDEPNAPPIFAAVLRSTLVSNPKRSLLFSLAMIIAGAVLGPFLDSYHSAFGVLEYNQPMSLVLWGSSAEHPALTTTWWVPELFGLAGFLIGWLYILLDNAAVFLSNATSQDTNNSSTQRPSPPKILLGISLFTFQYWLSGALYQSSVVDRTTILNIMSLVATSGFYVLDRSRAGFLASAATALGGPLIEAGLIAASRTPGLVFAAGYHYTDLGETGFFPLWIVPVYFLGGPAVGNLARGIWNSLSTTTTSTTCTTNVDAASSSSTPKCTVCNDTRCVPCPNCNGQGYYLATGNIRTKCTSCRSRGFVICRSCFANYDEDPEDIEAIRDLMSRMPD